MTSFEKFIFNNQFYLEIFLFTSFCFLLVTTITMKKIIQKKKDLEYYHLNIFCKYIMIYSFLSAFIIILNQLYYQYGYYFIIEDKSFLIDLHSKWTYDFLYTSEYTLLSKIFLFLTGLIYLYLLDSNYTKNTYEYMKPYDNYLLIWLSMLSMSIMISSFNFIIFFLALESHGLALVTFISTHKNQIGLQVGLKMFLASSFVSLIFLLGLSYLHGLIGSLNFTTLYFILQYL